MYCHKYIIMTIVFLSIYWGEKYNNTNQYMGEKIYFLSSNNLLPSYSFQICHEQFSIFIKTENPLGLNMAR